MEVIAFVGSSGTGKSHRALVLAHENKIECIIDVQSERSRAIMTL